MQQCSIQIKNIIQKQFKYRKGFQIEYFINRVVVFAFSLFKLFFEAESRKQKFDNPSLFFLWLLVLLVSCLKKTII